MNEGSICPVYMLFLKCASPFIYMCRKSPCPVPHLHRPHITHKFCMALCIGLTGNSFKDRFNSHQNTFRDRDKISSTDLSKFIMDVKAKNIDNVEMDWSIVEKSSPLKNASKRFELCLTEKYHIIFETFDLLNQRKKLLNKCRHRNIFLLCILCSQTSCAVLCHCFTDCTCARNSTFFV